jgi:hypothetical protein
MPPEASLSISAETRPWARDLDKATRAHLFWRAEFRTQIEEWRDTLAQNERSKLNHPTAMKRRYEATDKVPAVKDGEAKDGEKLTKAAEIVRLENENETLKREIDWLKARPTTDGGLFDLAKTDPKDRIARATPARMSASPARAKSATLRPRG